MKALALTLLAALTLTTTAAQAKAHYETLKCGKTRLVQDIVLGANTSFKPSQARQYKSGSSKSAPVRYKL